MPRISIVVPALNEEVDLPVLLDSLDRQTFRDFEVIVADAGSKDKTIAIAKKHKAKVVPGGMPAKGRNEGAKVAEGEFLFFFDADVELPPDFLEKAVQEMDDRFVDLATCEFKPKSDLRLDTIMFRMANLSVQMNTAINPRAAGFCIFITRRLFRRIGGFDETLKLAEDHDLVQRAVKFRPLRFLESVYLNVSVRRLEKEGRFSLIQKYFTVEKHLLLKGNVREDIVEYEFGNFTKDKEKSGKILDEIEGTIIQLERNYNQILRGEEAAGDGKDLREKAKPGIESLWKAVQQLIEKKPKS